MILATHESTTGLDDLDNPPRCAFGIVDEAGLAPIALAARSIAYVARHGGHLMIVGDPDQLPPTGLK